MPRHGHETHVGRAAIEAAPHGAAKGSPRTGVVSRRNARRSERSENTSTGGVPEYVVKDRVTRTFAAVRALAGNGQAAPALEPQRTTGPDVGSGLATPMKLKHVRPLSEGSPQSITATESCA